MNKTFIFGHKKPDTDSVTSAIALSYLKNKLGFNTEPRVLGNINNETKYVLNYFKVDTPAYLDDVHLQIRDLNYRKNNYINEFESIYNSFNYMQKHDLSNVPMVNKEHSFLGTISMKEIAKDLITGDFENLNTSYNNILDVLEAKEILRFNNEIKGKILLAAFRSTTFIDTVKLTSDDILVIGDRHSIIEFAVKSGVKLIILTGNSEIKPIHIEIAKANHVNIIKTEMYSYQVAKLINLCNYSNTILNKKDVICFKETDEVRDFIDIANKTKYSNYPIIDDNNKCLGVLKLEDAAEKNRKQVILVDHNEFEQSVEGLDEASIVEIIDHHKIGTIGTQVPINFRNMPVGSTNTIIYNLYKENNLIPPANIAGLMMAGILSDTLLLVSPTTTEMDKVAVYELSKLAKTDYEKFAYDMFKAGSSLENKTIEEIFYTDFKLFNFDKRKIGISQISTVYVKDILKKQEKYLALIEKIKEENSYDILALFVTDILNNGSYILFDHSSKDILTKCFDMENLEEGDYLDGIISRKKQIVPAMMNFLGK